MKINLRENKNGITLIALIITIIVLLILAGVSITTLTGENGILNRAVTAKEKNEKATIIENIKLDIAARKIDKLGENLGDITYEEVQEILSKYGTISSDKKKLITNDGNYEIPISSISSIESESVEISKNLYNKDDLSLLGEWCNYTNGKFETTKYVTKYKHTNFIKCKPNTEYARTYGTGALGTVFFDKKQQYIGYTRDINFTTPENCYFMIANVTTDININKFMILQTKDVINTYEEITPFIPYNNIDSELKLITIGSGGDFETIVEGFKYARDNDLGVKILPGTYDIIKEGVDIEQNVGIGTGLLLPKFVYGYGATIVANLENENWNFSPLNVDYRKGGHEVYGLTVICNNCRYCIHDEMGAGSNYHNIFKDLTLINNGNVSSVLIAPRAIGGGLGSNGQVDIINCTTQSNTNADIDYHSCFTGKQSEGSKVFCQNSVIKTTVTGTNLGNSKDFMNKLYVSDCLLGKLPESKVNNNMTIKAWNNELNN